jgi:hypothetical protein
LREQRRRDMDTEFKVTKSKNSAKVDDIAGDREDI